MIIIPDIHGRSFWKEAINGHENEEIIFLGDYLDPYSYEDEFKYLDNEKVHENIINNFKEIIDFKKNHLENVILLLGNHDLGYTCIDKASRFDYLHAGEIYNIYKDNWEIFQMAYEKVINGKRYIFSHAGISTNWLKNHELVLKEWNEENIVDWVNNAYLGKNGRFFNTLNDISFYRGGYNLYGSMVWGDFREYVKDSDEESNGLIGDYQIIGHTQLNENPFIWDNFANLDCRRAFILNEEGKISELDGTIIEKIEKPKEND